jgi:nitrite reductase (NADH) small subunit
MILSKTEVTLGPVDLIPAGEGRNFDVAGQRIAVFRSRSGHVFAVQAACPHKGGPLVKLDGERRIVLTVD